MTGRRATAGPSALFSWASRTLRRFADLARTGTGLGGKRSAGGLLFLGGHSVLFSRRSRTARAAESEKRSPWRRTGNRILVAKSASGVWPVTGRSLSFFRDARSPGSMSPESGSADTDSRLIEFRRPAIAPVRGIWWIGVEFRSASRFFPAFRSIEIRSQPS